MVTWGGVPLIGDLQRFKAGYLKAMAHPVRIRALEVLRQGPAGVAELQSQVDPGVGNISQHLAVLRNAGVVSTRKAGPSVVYSVRDPEVFAILDALREIFSHRLDSMQTTLAADEGAQSAHPSPPQPAAQRRRPGLGKSVRP